MVVELVDLMSLLVLPTGALIFLILAFIFRGMWWWSIMSGLLWILFGINSINTPAIFAFERELGVAWITIGIAIFWMPAWYKKKGQQLTLQEMAARQDGEDIDDDVKLEREVTRIRYERWHNSRDLDNKKNKVSAKIDEDDYYKR